MMSGQNSVRITDCLSGMPHDLPSGTKCYRRSALDHEAQQEACETFGLDDLPTEGAITLADTEPGEVLLVEDADSDPDHVHWWLSDRV